eukprot:TRINITY_DN87290_c0_g1_i1.p1 TRINITY_DN87290_c0_g1~~TRINITY_DN87290_c0_g1_i1.p1  ORF type:complete len:188 (+),score=35.97 TRINITY_DN87290_c0_g1_i1:87-650(+)
MLKGLSVKQRFTGVDISREPTPFALKGLSIKQQRSCLDIHAKSNTMGSLRSTSRTDVSRSLEDASGSRPLPAHSDADSRKNTRIFVKTSDDLVPVFVDLDWTGLIATENLSSSLALAEESVSLSHRQVPQLLSFRNKTLSSDCSLKAMGVELGSVLHMQSAKSHGQSLKLRPLELPVRRFDNLKICL